MYLSSGSPELAQAAHALELATRDHLKGFRDWNFRCLLACTFIVGIGLLIELPEIVHDMCETYGRKSRELKYWLTPSMDRREYPRRDWVRKWTALGWVLIVLGVMGEGVFEERVSKYDSALSNLNETLVAETQKEASLALEQASANQLEAQQLKAENLRLEAIIAPRSLRLDQQKRIADAWRKFQGHGVLVKSYATDGEGTALAGQIIATLQAASVAVADSRAAVMVVGGFDSGVHVRAPVAELAFAEAIADALSTIGKLRVFPVNDPEPRTGAAMGGGGQTFTNPNAVFVTITVGIKPLPTVPAK